MQYADVIDRVTNVAIVVHDEIKAFMFEANYKPGKSECVIRVAGPGAKAVQQRLTEMNNVITRKAAKGTFMLRVVTSYRHLGIPTVPDCKHGLEIQARKQSCNAAVGPIASKCFSIKAVPFPRKRGVAKAYMFSRLCYAAGGWSILTGKEARSFAAAAMYVWRRATGTTYVQRRDEGLLPMTDDQVTNTQELIAPATMVRLAKLKLFARLVNCSNNNTLKVVVYAARRSQFSWIKAVEADFVWLLEVDRRSGLALLSGVHTLQEWVVQLQLDNMKCRRDIKKICMCSKANRIEDAEISLPNATLEEIFECEVCAKPCPSLQQLAVHRFNQHGLGADARLYISELNDCPICLRRFATRQQAVTHLSKDAKICKTSYVHHVEVLPLDYIEQCEARANSLRLEQKCTGMNSGQHPPTIRGPLQQLHIAAFCRRPLEDPDD